MITLGDQLRNWRSRHQLSRQEAATALGVTIGTIDDLERGNQVLSGQAREALIEKLSRSPRTGIRGSVPDAGYRPGEY